MSSASVAPEGILRENASVPVPGGEDIEGWKGLRSDKVVLCHLAVSFSDSLTVHIEVVALATSNMAPFSRLICFFHLPVTPLRINSL